MSPSNGALVGQRFDVVIVGAGHAGTQLATSLAAAQSGLQVALIGDEPHAPYNRPTLSKSYLLGNAEFADIQLRTPEFWSSSDIALRSGCAVTAVDPRSRVVTCADGTELQYRSLVWATGGRARRLPTALGTAPYYTVRALADVHTIQPALATARHATIIGGGYVGLETAAVLRTQGIEVTLIEAAPRVLARVAGQEISGFFEAEHRRAGVDVRTNTNVAKLAVRGAQTTVRLDDGNEFTTDLVIVGIGMLPNVEVLQAAGAVVDDGVLVDGYCRTSLSDVFAIGDCARHVNRFAGGTLTRLECVQNAADQAKVVHGVLSGAPVEYDAVPWFWSNQYDIQFKSAGLTCGAKTTIVRGEVEARAFSVVYLRDGVVVAVDCVNAPRDFMQARKLIAAEARLDPAAIRDPSLDLRDTVCQLGAATARSN